MHCESDIDASSCCEDEATSEDCCTNVFHQINTDKEFSVNSSFLSFSSNFIAPAKIDFYKFIEITNYDLEEIPSYFNPPLPPWKQDILVFHQTFLI